MYLIITHAIWAHNSVVSRVVRSGDVDLGYISLRDVGNNSYDWSDTAYSNANNAYHLAFTNTSTFPSYYYARWHGYSVRCISF